MLGTDHLSATEECVSGQDRGCRRDAHRHERQALPRCKGGVGGDIGASVGPRGLTFGLFMFIVDRMSCSPDGDEPHRCGPVIYTYSFFKSTSLRHEPSNNCQSRWCSLISEPPPLTQPD